MAKLNYCTFELGESLFGIEVHQVQEVLSRQPLTRVPLAHEMVRGLANLRGEIVTAIDLRRRLGRADGDGDGVEAVYVVVRTTAGICSLVVDRVGEVVEVDEDELRAPPGTMGGSGKDAVRSVVAREGWVMLVLDVERAVSLPVIAGGVAELGTGRGAPEMDPRAGRRGKG